MGTRNLAYGFDAIRWLQISGLQMYQDFTNIGDCGAYGFLELGTQIVGNHDGKVAIHQRFKADEELAFDLAYMDIVGIAQVGNRIGSLDHLLMNALIEPATHPRGR